MLINFRVVPESDSLPGQLVRAQVGSAVHHVVSVSLPQIVDGVLQRQQFLLLDSIREQIQLLGRRFIGDIDGPDSDTPDVASPDMFLAEYPHGTPGNLSGKLCGAWELHLIFPDSHVVFPDGHRYTAAGDVILPQLHADLLRQLDDGIKNFAFGGQIRCGCGAVTHGFDGTAVVLIHHRKL